MISTEVKRDLANAPPVPAIKLTDEECFTAMQRIASGDYMLTVTQDYGLAYSYFYTRALREPELAEMLEAAMAVGTFARLERAEMAIDGVKGYTTGSIERDKAKADLAKWLGAKLNRRTFGDRPLISGDSINVTINAPLEDYR